MGKHGPALKLTSSRLQVYIDIDIDILVGVFSHILGIIIPTDQYFSGWLKPPTSIDGLPIKNCDFPWLC